MPPALDGERPGGSAGSEPRHWQGASRAVLRAAAAALLVTWCGWQVIWLAQARLPPALFLAITGLPAPTTGGTRSLARLFRGDWSLARLFRGDWKGSVQYNAMAVPITLLFGLTVGWLLIQGLRRRGWRVPRFFLPAWLGLLGLAWAIKLAQHFLVGDEVL
jgi:hypothetical protein